MINMITPFIKDMPKHTLTPYQTFLGDQASFISYRKEVFDSALGHESRGIKLLRYIFSNVDFPYLDQQISNLDRYMYHIRFIRKSLIDIFDRVQRGGGYYNLFFSKNNLGTTEEFVFPIEDVNTLTNLPILSDDWMSWRNVRPLRLWYYNSGEFTTNIINDQIHFKFLPPAYSVFLLDVVALVLKYYTWYHTERYQEQAEELAIYAPQQLFLHKYVMSDLIWDMADIWLLNMLRKLMLTESFDDLKKFDSYSLQYETQYGRVALTSRRGYEHLWTRIVEAKKNLRPEVILSSNLLYGGSLNDRIRLVTEQLTLPLGRQYEYLRWLRDKDLFILFLQIWSKSYKTQTFTNICRRLKKEFRFVLNHRPWNNCQNILLKNEVRKEIEHVADVFL